MKKTKSIIILISVFFAFISTVNAKEYKSIEELMKDIPSSLTLDIKDIDLLTTSKEDTYNYFESISNSIEEKVTKKLSSILGINLEDLTINGKKYYFYEFTEYDENDLNPYNLRKRTFRISDHEDLDLEKNITIHYTNDNKYNETDKKYVENATKNIYTAMYLTSDKYSIFGSDLTDEFSEYTEFVEYSINNKNVKLSPIYSIGMGGSYLSSGMSVLFYVIYKDVVYSSYVGNISIYTNFDIPSNIADTEKAYIDYVKPILKSKYNINVKSYKPVSNNLYDITFDECEDTNECWEMEERIVIGKPGIKRIMDNVTIDTGRLFPSGTILPENNSIYKELKTKVDAKNYNVLAAYDLKTTSGALYDDATLTFTIGNQYNGKKILLVSKNGNNIQEVSTIAKNGQVSIKVRALYPFMLGVEKFTDIIYNNSTKEWEYYKDGIFTPSYSGVAANKNGTYYVDKGVITFNHNELINYNKNWVAVINSKLNPTYTGISTNKNGSYYL
ncbi:MAG TPA: hypothetical protein DCE23_02185, partial [Firmicutes bacterium]|nr:hypothetical protein [Bacillota bacterium]